MDGISASIVIPVFNSERYLRTCLESVLSQTRGDFEVICVDNGSTDESLKILEEFSRLDCRVVVLREPRPGVSCARNAGIARARGQYLLFVDSDDTVEPTFVELAVGAAEKYHTQLVIFSYLERYQEPPASIPWVRAAEGPGRERVFATRDLNVPAMLIATPNVVRITFDIEYLRSLNLSFPEELRTSEDLVYVYRALLPATRVVLTDDVLYHYRRDRVESLTRKDRHAAGVQALRLIYEALEELRGEEWFAYQFTNLVLDTFEYQMRTSATAEEYLELFEGYQREWADYVCSRAELVHDRYLGFFSSVESGDPVKVLFSLHANEMRGAEFYRVWDQAHKEELTSCHETISNLSVRSESLERELASVRDQLEAVRVDLERACSELEGIYASRSWKLARSMARIVHLGKE